MSFTYPSDVTDVIVLYQCQDHVQQTIQKVRNSEAVDISKNAHFDLFYRKPYNSN